jgi:hypothetical protein
MKAKVQTNAQRNEPVSRLAVFLQALGLDLDAVERMSVIDKRMLHAKIGQQSKKMKRRLVKGGWIRTERNKVGNSEFETVYQHPDLKGCVSLTEFSTMPWYNKAYVTSFKK